MNEDTSLLAALRADARDICLRAVEGSLPDAAVARALADIPPCGGETVVVAIGKAAWSMAQSAQRALGDGIARGLIVTKHGHARGALPRFAIREAGHPVPDENSLRAAEEAIALVSGLRAEDRVLLLISGGGSALFEKSDVPLAELRDITAQLLASGADIGEINTVRKHLSRVKGGRFGALCAPARVYAVLLSDVLGDRPDVIASGLAYPDASTCAQAEEIVRRRGLRLSPEALRALREETPKALPDVVTMVTGGVRQLCADAAKNARARGYETVLLTDALSCEAREAGRMLASLARAHAGDGRRRAFIAGGETVVTLTGDGLGGRNQELALAAAEGIGGLNAVVISIGSDGTDGPTDAAGGIVDGRTAEILARRGISIPEVLRRNDSYHALSQCGGLIVTGATGTNVNDVSVLLLG